MIHLGYNNPIYLHIMSDNLNSNMPLSETTAEKDLGSNR